MNPLLYIFLLFCTIGSANPFIGHQPVPEDPNLKLWYDKPASIWEEALPPGNGKTGAMIFGGIVTERFQLNDITLWSGYPEDGNNPAGPEILKKTGSIPISIEYPISWHIPMRESKSFTFK